MKKGILIVALTLLVSSFLFGQATLEMHYDASGIEVCTLNPDNDRITFWRDNSTFNRDTWQGNFDNQPFKEVIAGIDVVGFQGNQWLDADIDDFVNFPVGPAIDIYIIWKTNSDETQFAVDGQTLGNRNAIFKGTGGGSNIAAYAGSTVSYDRTTPFDWILTQARFSGVDSFIMENGVSQVTGNFGTQILDALRIGARADNLSFPLNGYIAEIRVYSGSIEDLDDVNITNELIDTVNTLPVELSSFNAIVTNDMFVQVEWTAETETNMMGYNIYRSESQNINEAVKVNGTIIGAHNSSEPMDYIYVDETVEPGHTYYYWLQANDLDLTYNFHGPISILVNDEGEPGTGITPELVTALKGAYPNPFNPGTNVSFSLAEAADVTITIYNNKGQLVKTLVDNQSYNKGDHHSEYWDGTDLNGRTVSSGIYYYIMRTNDGFEQSKKMMLMK